ncbi:hypothetical protein L905_09690 [Agrobacterium sp. TS43]|nr:hypothetical protein L905_09690 [Agrobacterium sp. TS43]
MIFWGRIEERSLMAWLEAGRKLRRKNSHLPYRTHDPTNNIID